jgi:hypothetical protein
MVLLTTERLEVVCGIFFNLKLRVLQKLSMFYMWPVTRRFPGRDGIAKKAKGVLLM